MSIPTAGVGEQCSATGRCSAARHNRLKSARVPFAWELRQLAKRRLAYYPPGVSGTITRPARRAPASRRSRRTGKR